MKQKMFRLTDDQIMTLKLVAERRGCTESDVIRSCIESLGDDTRDSEAKSPDILEKQLAEKDRQIDRLLDALVVSQEQTKAAQALNAADKKEVKALESSEQKKTRWQRLKEAWRG